MKKRTLKQSKAKKKTKAKTKKRKSISKRPSSSKPREASRQKPVGVVTHFFTNIRVAIVRFKQKVPAGVKLHYKGATTDFVDTAKSMQYDHKTIAAAPKGKQIGIKVKKRVREGDQIYIEK